MNKTILFGIFAACVGVYAPAMADGFAIETETLNTYETITIDTVKYTDANYVAPRPVRTAKPVAPCRVSSSLDVARGCNDCVCNKSAHTKLKPVRVKTYTEVIDHYQVYEPVVTYKPAGTYTTRRYVDAKDVHCGTCAR